MGSSPNNWDRGVREIWSHLPCGLPPEIWQIILNEITDMKTLSNTNNVGNVGLCELLRPRKHEFLFHTVLPLLLPYLEGRDLWKMRAVCKTWQTHVDFVLENGPRYRNQQAPAGNEMVPLVSIPRDLGVFQEASVTFKKGAEIIDFLIRMRAFIPPPPANANYNPIPGRSVCFSPVTGQLHVAELVRFEQHMRLFLGILGEHIWHFYYKMPLYESPLHAVNMMTNTLRALPNLRTLHLEEGFHWFSRAVVSERQLLGVEDPRRDGPMDFPQLQNLMEIVLPSHSVFHRHLLQDITTHYRPQVANFRYTRITHPMAVVSVPMNGPSTVQIRDQIRENARVDVVPPADRRRAVLSIVNEAENDEEAE